MLPYQETPLPLSLPLPTDNQSYTTQEIIVILQPFNNNIRSGDKARLIGHIVRRQYKTRKRSILYRLLKRNRCGLLVPSDIATTPGYPIILQNNVIESLNREMQEYNGLPYERDKIEKNLVEKYRKV